MSRICSLLLLVVIAAGCRQEPPAPPPTLRHFVSAALLRDHLSRPNAPLVLDVRRRAEYEAGHLPGSVSLPLASLTPGPAGDLSAAARRRIAEALRKAGVRAGLPVVVAAGGGVEGFRDAAVACWVLSLAGQDDCHLLEGGVMAWTAAGGELVRTAYAPLKVGISSVALPPHPATWADIDLLRRATASPQPVLVDARNGGVHDSIPGALRLPLERAVDEQGRVDRKILKELVADSGLLLEEEVVILGERLADGAAAWYLLRHSGRAPSARLYPGGFSRYRTIGGLPLEPEGGGTPPRKTAPAG